MAKRTADTQLVKDGPPIPGFPDGEVQVQKATTAQLANRRILRGRGSGRRPATPSRPLPSPFRNLQQPAQSSTSNVTSNTSNIAQQPTGAFSFGQQASGATQGSNQTNSSNNQHTSQSAPFSSFAPSDTGFNFSPVKGAALNNPFGIENDTGKYGKDDPVPTSQFGGYQGSLFSLPASASAPKSPSKAPDPSHPVKKRNSYSQSEKDAARIAGEQAPQFVAHAPFVWATDQPVNQDNANPQPPPEVFQGSANTFQKQIEYKPNQPYDNHLFVQNMTQPQQAVSNIFGQNTSLFQQPSNNTLGQSSGQPQQLAKNPFEQQPSQASSNMFQQQFEQNAAQPQQSTNDIFQQQPQQPNSNMFEQQQHFQHTNNNMFEPQSQQPNSSIFEQQQQPNSNMFEQHSQHSSSNIFGQHNQQPSSNTFGQHSQQTSSNTFGQHSQEPNSNLFGPPSQQSQESRSNMSEQQSQLPNGNMFEHQSPQLHSDRFVQNATQPRQSDISVTQAEELMSISPDNSPPNTSEREAGPFASLAALTAPGQGKNPTIQRSGGSLFDRITQPPGASASSAGDGQNSSQIFSQHKPEATKVQGSSLFDRISTPSIQDDSASTSVSNPFELVMSKPVYSGPSTSPTKSPPRPRPDGSLFAANKANNAPPAFSLPKPQDAKSTASDIFGSFNPLSASQRSSASSLSPNKASASASPQNLESNGHIIDSNGKPSAITTMTKPRADRAVGTPPDPPPEFTEDQKRQLVTGYRLKALDLGIQKHIKKSSKSDAELEAIFQFYQERKQTIIDAGGLPLKPIAGKKRKSANETQRDGVADKRAKLDASSHVPQSHTSVANGSILNGSPLLQSKDGQGISAKRRPEGDMDEDAGQGAANSAKRARGEHKIAYPSLPTSTSNSQTSSIFKNVLGTKEQTPTKRTVAPAASGSDKANASDPKSSNTTVGSLFQSKPSSTTGSSSPFATSRSPSKATPAASMLPHPNSVTTFPQKGSLAPAVQPSASLNANPFSIKPTSTDPPFKAPFASMTQPPFNVTSTSFSVKTSTTEETSPPAVQPPTFGVGAPSNFLSQFGKTAEETAKKEKAKRKAEDFDSDEEDEVEWERKDAEQQRAKKQKLEEALKPRKATFVPGKGFVLGDDGVDKEEERSNKTGAAGSDVFKASALTNSSASVFASKPATQGVVSSHNIFGHLTDVDSGAESSKTGDADDEDDGSEGASDHDRDSDRNVRIRGTGRTLSQQKDTNLSEKAPSFANNNPFGAATDRWSQPSRSSTSQAPSSGLSLFDRISRDESGNAIREIPPASEKKPESTTSEPSLSSNTSSIFSQAPSSGSDFNIFGQSASAKPSSSLFGQSFAPASASTPSKPTSNLFGQPSSSTSGSNLSKPISNIFGQSSSSAPTTDAGISGSSPQGDHTWKPDTPIKFGSTVSAPGVTITSPTPSKASFGGLFGSPSANALTETPAKPTASMFSTTPSKSPGAAFGFAFGGPPKTSTSTLAPSLGVASNTTSRATSPGATTTGESANESAADGDDVVERHEQIDLTSGGPGEEDEDVIFEVKAKASSFDASSKTWTGRGVGLFRVLKHRETSKARMVLRQETIGKVILNAALLSAMKYDHAGNKAVKMAIASDSGKLETWMVRTGKDEDAQKLANVLEENKAN